MKKDIRSGAIVRIRIAGSGSRKAGSELLLLRKLRQGTWYGLPVEKMGGTRGAEWAIQILPGDLEKNIPGPKRCILSDQPLNCGEDAILQVKGQGTPVFLERVLRAQVRFTSSLYYKAASSRPASSHVPVSGKVLDEQDLYNMVDASLDMWLTTGRFNEQFQQALQSFLKARYVLTVNSGSSANLLALTALTSPKLGKRRLQEGDEVITVAAGFPTTITPIIQNRLVPVFVDILPGTYDIDVSQIEQSISARTRAIMIAHTLGNPFDIRAITEIAKKHDLWLVEDNCDALGSRYDGRYTGTSGHLATLSFYPAHHITTGEGGAVIVNDPSLYKIVMSYRDWGRDCWCETGKDNTCGKRFGWQLGALPEGYDHKYIYSHLGYNLKMTDWQAAIGLSQLQKLPSFIKRRQENFNKLHTALIKFKKYLILPEATPGSRPSWFGFPITVREETGITRKHLVSFLEEHGIATRQLFAGNILRQPAFTGTDCRLRIKDSSLLTSAALNESHYRMLPVSEYVMRNTFWIGVTPLLTPEKTDAVIKQFKLFFKGAGK